MLSTNGSGKPNHKIVGLRKLHNYIAAVANLGFVPSILYKLQQLRNTIVHTNQPFFLYSKYARYPLMCRPHTSDINVFDQVFVAREYRCLDDLRDASLIVDCGANVGFSSAYFLTRFPKAHVIAVEPDHENFAILKANLAPYEGRYRAIRSAVWSEPVGLVFSERAFGDGREWARTVMKIRDGEHPAMVATDIGTLLKDSGVDRISILKIDIEGAEAVVFSSHYEHWIERVDTLVIELHGDECRSMFGKAISTQKFNVSQSHELTVCRRLPHASLNPIAPSARCG